MLLIVSSGRLARRRYKLLVGRRDATKLVAGVQRQVELVRDALAGDPRLSDDVSAPTVLPSLSGWATFRHLIEILVRWAMRKYKRLRFHTRRARKLLA